MAGEETRDSTRDELATQKLKAHKEKTKCHKNPPNGASHLYEEDSVGKWLRWVFKILKEMYLVRLFFFSKREDYKKVSD